MTTDNTAWFWGRYAPESWFADDAERSNSSLLIRGYLALGVTAPETTEELAVWSANFSVSRLQVSWFKGSFTVPPPVTYRYVGGENVQVSRDGDPVRLPPGIYVVLMAPVAATYRQLDDATEREAIARLDMLAGIISGFVSPNAIFQHTFEFLTEVTGPGTRVMSPPVRRPGSSVELNDDRFRTMSGVLQAIGNADDRLRARATTSLRWYAYAQSERVRSDAFVNYWVALEALVLSGNGSPIPLINLLATAYNRDAQWVRETFGINALAQLRNDIVHRGQRPMLHGNLLAFVDALYLDALRARLGLPNERKAETALPDGRPFRLHEWRNSGAVATAYLPEAHSVSEQ